MQRLIRQYQEKNKIIQQIQKNIRRAYHKQSKSLEKKPSDANALLIDLPAIVRRNQKSPKAQHSPSQAQFPGLNTKEPSPEKSPRDKRLCVQTISFRGHEERTVKPILLVNHRATLRNFMRQTQRSLHQQSLQQNGTHYDMFLTPHKIVEPNFEKNLRDTIRRKKNLQLLAAKTSQTSAINELPTNLHPISGIRQAGLYETKVQDQYDAENEENKRQYEKMYAGETYKPRGHQKGRHRSKRSCSPWSSDRQGEFITQMFNI